MKTSKKILASAVAASILSLGALAPVAQAEVSASAGVSNMYYWRGHDLGLGAQVSGSLGVSSESGFYASTWAGSGDALNGTEWDIGVGYGGEFGAVTVDLSVWNYNYPSAYFLEEDSGPDIGDVMEVILSVGVGPVTATYYHGIEELEDYWYGTIKLALGDKFGVTYGQHESFYGSHLDLSYSYNDNLSFTLGTLLDDDDVGYDTGEPRIVVSYSLPIE